MINREIESKIKEAVKKYPVITLTGPRQSGKTTLLKNAFPDYDYVNLEDPEIRNYAIEDSRGFLSQFKKGVILDEVQRVPELFSYIQVIVDQEQQNGRFILSGSQNFLLLGGISQSLAGRTSIFHLLPFTKREIENRKPLVLENLIKESVKLSEYDLFKTVHTGFYPRIHDKNLDPQEWLGDYFQTYIQRDVRIILNVSDITLFSNFVSLCAGRVGQLLNLSSLGADCGISHSTAQRWLSLLESSFIVYRINSHHKNFSKRIIKSPKLYFYDSGLLCYLLRIKTPEDLRISSYRGNIFESFCISEFIKSSYNKKQNPDIHFWRDSTGHEIDMLIEDREKLLPVEIKSGQTFNSSFLDGVKYWIDLSGCNKNDAYLIYGGDKKITYKGINVIPWYLL
ncbi:MAG: ATP-binding protein [Candidatus Delongbacteria bacterium]|jgi:predicted AAA+ superfamily ATPase|nr:ATP-binding protein [Candidatus Delongbacteria bacterium]